MNTFSNKQTAIAYKEIMSNAGTESIAKRELRLYAAPTYAKSKKLMALAKIEGVKWFEIKKALNVKSGYQSGTILASHDVHLKNRDADLRIIKSGTLF